MKRTLDAVVAGFGLVVLLPVLILICVLVRITLGRPILFVQERTGVHGEVFRLYKFRTMRDARDRDGTLLPDGDRLNRVGRFLRAASLDELPTLLNVLKGDMSLVGPRPLLPNYLERYTPEQARRHQVRPGITGWAQVNGRNALTWDEKLSLDAWYVDHQSTVLDLKILALTIPRVIFARGISRPGHATMPEFSGPGRRRSGSGASTQDEGATQ